MQLLIVAALALHGEVAPLLEWKVQCRTREVVIETSATFSSMCSTHLTFHRLFERKKTMTFRN